MGSKRSKQERERAAERKAAADAREVVSRAEHSASRNERMRNGLIWDAGLAIFIGLVLLTAWKVILLLVGAVGVP